MTLQKLVKTDRVRDAGVFEEQEKDFKAAKEEKRGKRTKKQVAEDDDNAVHCYIEGEEEDKAKLLAIKLALRAAKKRYVASCVHHLCNHKYKANVSIDSSAVNKNTIGIAWTDGW
jgi:hypothetical protein